MMYTPEANASESTKNKPMLFPFGTYSTERKMDNIEIKVVEKLPSQTDVCHCFQRVYVMQINGIIRQIVLRYT